MNVSQCNVLKNDRNKYISVHVCARVCISVAFCLSCAYWYLCTVQCICESIYCMCVSEEQVRKVKTFLKRNDIF